MKLKNIKLYRTWPIQSGLLFKVFSTVSAILIGSLFNGNSGPNKMLSLILYLDFNSCTFRQKIVVKML